MGEMTDRAGGRPAGPTEETAGRVLKAAFELLATEGSAALTPVRLHQETGVARTTIYRHWPTPRHLLLAILGPATKRHEIDDLVGEIGADLRTAVGTLTTRFETRPVRTFFDGLRVHDGNGEKPSLSEQYIEGLIAPVRAVIAAAVERGELHGEADRLVLEICGPLLAEFLLLGRRVKSAEVEQAITDFLDRHQLGGST